LLWIVAITLPGNDLRVVFADVGQGDMAIITTPGGHRIVVDGGPSPANAAQAVSSTLPFWARSIDLAVLTHPHSDHVSGLTEILERYDVRHVLEREFDYDTPQYADWRRVVGNEGAVELSLNRGMALAFDDGVVIEVLGPPTRLLNNTASDIDNASAEVRVV
jgi:competence protein ComEC|tara:strand:- start:1651 stop:2136 length:486 start_codon:yes stop_codon:yes gene_type:complete